MRLDWIFLPRENPCAKFYIIIVIIIIIIMFISRIPIMQCFNWLRFNIKSYIKVEIKHAK